MNELRLKPTHRVVKAYYTELDNLVQLSLFTEGAVSPTFAALLRHCAGQLSWTLAEQFTIRHGAGDQRAIRVDGALLDPFKLRRGVWEAKDSGDDLEREADRKFKAGYPRDNILFQEPKRAILWQNGYEVVDADISRPPALVDVLQEFFAYQPPAFEQWEQAVAEFKLRVPELAAGLLGIIEQERRANPRFVTALGSFAGLCRQTVNPNLSDAAVEEMLVQHLLTERIFRKVFDNPDFAGRNAIAREIETVVQALTAQHFSRQEFFRPLDRFYGAIETTAATIDDFSQKQAFLNTVYEQFFQGFSVRVADTHGIVYTPQPVVAFMVRSVEEILRREFGRSLSDEGVPVLDPFVGTGNFILHVMRAIRRSCLPQKYAGELYCNEVMLLPYYIAAMNIEHEYAELAGAYRPFEGLCLVDTFELAESKQMSLFTAANTERVERQKAAPIFVILGNPPYNAWQVNENDNNRNRRYPVIDRRVAETYAHDSTATNKNALSDMYVKAIRWASDRIGDEGIVAFVSNNSFVNDLAFDGMRKHLAQDFCRIYHVDLKGDARTSGEQRRREGGNVFHDAIRVGVGITFFVRKRGVAGPVEIYIYSAGDYLKAEDKQRLLEETKTCFSLPMQRIVPDRHHTWLTAGLQDEFETFLPLGTKEAKEGIDQEAVFENFSNGVKTNRDTWVYNFSRDAVTHNVRHMLDAYNQHVYRLSRLSARPNLDDFVSADDVQISWSEGLKNCLGRRLLIEYDEATLRRALYRPFVTMHLYFAPYVVERRYQMPHILPTPDAEAENQMIWLKVGSNWPMFALMTNRIPDVLPQGGSQCFPFYVYDEDGSNRRENVTDWALAQFRAHYGDAGIAKWDIFHYVYALLHHPAYRQTYAANLRRELPRIPFAPDFGGFARAGARLAELHVGYESQPEYPLAWVEDAKAPLSYRVEQMRLSRDRARLVVNDFLTLAGIPPAAFEYRLGHRSALEWVIDQYRVSTDKRSGIANDPNRPGDPQYIVRLVGRMITVSLETVNIVKALPQIS